MAGKRLLILMAIIILGLTGCESSSSNSITVRTSFPAILTSTPTVLISPEFTLTQSPELNNSQTEPKTSTPTVSPTTTPTIPPDTQIQSNCLEVLLEIPIEVVSRGVVVLGRGSGGQDRRYETLLLNMKTNETTSITFSDETQLDHVISVDKTLIAYSRYTFNEIGTPLKHLVIANANGQIQKVFLWEDNWAKILRWTVDNHILIAYDDPDLREKENWSTVFGYLDFNPFKGGSELINPVFPGHLINVTLPYWDGWFGAVYDPTLTRTIYPQMLSNSEEYYTYALWDASNHKVIFNLESIYVDWVASSVASPKPVWSDDGSRFAFVGLVYLSNQPTIELYQVSIDGEIEQLTNWSSIARWRGFPFSWSPDGGKIAMMLNIHPNNDDFYVLVLDLETRGIIDTCIPARINPAVAIQPPIWSPDGRQILAKDWVDDSHSRIILIDVEQGFAAQIAEDVDLNGWMISP